MDRDAFERAKLKVLLKQNDPHGFGTLKEKTVHAVMKLYYEPDEDYHEVPIEGYIADIYTGERIIEIQTAFQRGHQLLDTAPDQNGGASAHRRQL